MSSNKHDGHANHHHQKGSAKPSLSKEKIEETKEEGVSPDTEGQKKNCGDYHPHEIAINIPEKKDKWDIANRIALGTGVVTLAYFVATVCILRVANATFNETKKEFEAINRPFIQTGNMKIDSIQIDKKPTINFSIINSGKFPATILSDTFLIGVGSGDDRAIIDSFRISTKKRGESINENISSFPVFMPKTVTGDYFIPSQYAQIKDGTSNIYLLVSIKYIDYINKTGYIKNEIFKISVSPTYNISSIENDESNF